MDPSTIPEPVVIGFLLLLGAGVVIAAVIALLWIWGGGDPSPEQDLLEAAYRGGRLDFVSGTRFSHAMAAAAAGQFIPVTGDPAEALVPVPLDFTVTDVWNGLGRVADSVTWDWPIPVQFFDQEAE